MQVLRGIVVVHGHGDLEVHAAEQVHRPDQVLQIQHGVAVRLKAGEHADVAAQRVDAVAALQAVAPVDGVHLPHLPVGVDERIPGDADKVEAVRPRVQPAEEERIRIAVAVVVSYQKQGVNAALRHRLRRRGARRRLGASLFPDRAHGLGLQRRFVFFRRLLPDPVDAVKADERYGSQQRRSQQQTDKFGHPVFHLAVPHVDIKNSEKSTKKYRRRLPLLYYCIKISRSLDFNTKKC